MNKILKNKKEQSGKRIIFKKVSYLVELYFEPIEVEDMDFGRNNSRKNLVNLITQQTKNKNIISLFTNELDNQFLYLPVNKTAFNYKTNTHFKTLNNKISKTEFVKMVLKQQTNSNFFKKRINKSNELATEQNRRFKDATFFDLSTRRQKMQVNRLKNKEKEIDLIKQVQYDYWDDHVWFLKNSDGTYKELSEQTWTDCYFKSCTNPNVVYNTIITCVYADLKNEIHHLIHQYDKLEKIQNGEETISEHLKSVYEKLNIPYSKETELQSIQNKIKNFEINDNSSLISKHIKEMLNMDDIQPISNNNRFYHDNDFINDKFSIDTNYSYGVGLNIQLINKRNLTASDIQKFVELFWKYEKQGKIQINTKKTKNKPLVSISLTKEDYIKLLSLDASEAELNEKWFNEEYIFNQLKADSDLLKEKHKQYKIWNEIEKTLAIHKDINNQFLILKRKNAKIESEKQELLSNKKQITDSYIQLKQTLKTSVNKTTNELFKNSNFLNDYLDLNDKLEKEVYEVIQYYFEKVKPFFNMNDIESYDDFFANKNNINKQELDIFVNKAKKIRSNKKWYQNFIERIANKIFNQNL